MASYSNIAAKENASSFLAQPLVFQRGEGVLRAKKASRKTALRLKHIIFLFLLLAGIFYSFYKAYLFLISWDKLSIRRVDIVCARPELRLELDRAFQKFRLGNILLCDIENLRTQIRSLAWVKEARIRKIFPSSLCVEITEREPKALIRRLDLTLIDAEGVELERRVPENGIDLPVLADRSGFRKNYLQKLKLAWACLDSLSKLERTQVAGLDLTDRGMVELQFKDDPVRIKLGDNSFEDKIRYYLERKPEWESLFGVLEYVDLRFDDRIYIKAQEIKDTETPPGSQKEAE